MMMMENGFSSPRNEVFPAGLRVLVVDDDPTWLKILEKMLKKCSYEVTTCGLAREALKLLRERKDGYDIVISDVNMPDMDGFKLLEHVGLEMDLPVIMMSVDGETSRVMKGVQHGACDYLLKPIRMKELKNIWQHVFRKKIHEVRDIEGLEVMDGIQIIRNGLEQSDEGHFLSGEEVFFGRKRKYLDNKHDDRDPSKKARVVWSVELHQKFVNAVNQIGYDKIGPKKILDLMNVPWLTRENVASHLQKYRLYLGRLQKENELKSTFGGLKHSDSPPKDTSESSSLQNPMKIRTCEAPKSSCGVSGGNSVVQRGLPNAKEVDPKGIASTPMSEHKRSLTVDIPSPRKAKSGPLGFDHSLSPLGSEVSFNSFDSSLPRQYSWSEIPEIQTSQESKPVLFDDSFSQIPLSGQHPYIMNSAPSLTETDVKPSYEIQISNNISRVTPATENDLLGAQGKNSVVTLQDFDLSIPSTISCTKFHDFNTNTLDETDSIPRTLNCGVPHSHFPASMDDDLQLYLLQGDCFPTNVRSQNMESAEYNNQGLFSEFPVHLYDAVRFDYEHLYDPTEYSLVDQGLFIA